MTSLRDGRTATGYLRRAIGIVVCLSPPAIAVASVFAGPRSYHPLVLLSLAFAAWVASMNFYLSFVRPWLYRRRQGSLEGYRFVSGLPIIATTIVVLMLLTNFGARIVAVSALVILALDTGGLPWFLISTWRDDGLWDPGA